MDKKEMDKKKILWIAGAAALLIVVGVVLFFVLGKEEEAYRNIRVTEVVGEVTVNRENLDNLKVKENMNLESGDEVLTGEGAKLTLRLDDDKYVVLDENTKVVLVATGTKEDSKTRLELEYGAIFSDIKTKLSEDSDYQICTPSSTMSVRGTQFEVAYRELLDNTGNVIGKEIKVLTFDGAVAVAPEGEKEERVSIPGTMEVLLEDKDGEALFEGETRQIEAKDLSEMSATYLKDDIEKNLDKMSEKERKQKEALLNLAEEYLEEILPELEKQEAIGGGSGYSEEEFDLSKHGYQFVPLEGRNWEEILAYCEEAGGQIATILSEEENTYLYEKMAEAGYKFAYFGYTDEATEGEWVWATGAKKGYENWREEDLDNYREEDYGMLWQERPYYWNDGGLRESDGYFICEWILEDGSSWEQPGATTIPKATAEPKPTATATPAPTATLTPTTAPTSTAVPTAKPKPTEKPKPATTAAPKPIVGPAGSVQYVIPRVIRDVGAINAPDMNHLLSLLEEYYFADCYVSKGVSVNEKAEVRHKEISDMYIAKGWVYESVKAAYGKDAAVTCDGFYGMADPKFYSMYDPQTFGSIGLRENGFLDLYAVYMVQGDGVSDRFMPCVLTIRADGKDYVYVVALPIGKYLECPKVTGRALRWEGGVSYDGGKTIMIQDGCVNDLILVVD